MTRIKLRIPIISPLGQIMQKMAQKGKFIPVSPKPVYNARNSGQRTTVKPIKNGHIIYQTYIQLTHMCRNKIPMSPKTLPPLTQQIYMIINF